MRFAFIGKHRAHHPVNRLCQIVDDIERGYRSWCSRPMSKSQRKDMVFLAHIGDQLALSLGRNGRPHMTEELKTLSFDALHRQVGGLMRENNLKVKQNRKFKVGRENYLTQRVKFPESTLTAITTLTSRLTCCIATYIQTAPTKSRLVI